MFWDVLAESRKGLSSKRKAAILTKNDGIDPINSEMWLRCRDEVKGMMCFCVKNRDLTNMYLQEPRTKCFELLYPVFFSMKVRLETFTALGKTGRRFYKPENLTYVSWKMLEMENDNIPFKKWFFFICDTSMWGGVTCHLFLICCTFKKGDASPFNEGDTSLEDPALLIGSDLSLQRWIVTSKFGWKGHGLESPGFLFSFRTKIPLNL